MNRSCLKHDWPQKSTVRLPMPILSNFTEIHRPKGYGLAENHCLSVEVKIGSNIGVGYGEDFHIDLAKRKAESEGVERAVLASAKDFGLNSRSSNGWACHFTQEQAVLSGVSELIERHVA